MLTVTSVDTPLLSSSPDLNSLRFLPVCLLVKPYLPSLTVDCTTGRRAPYSLLRAFGAASLTVNW